jgi:hypothetical protein
MGCLAIPLNYVLYQKEIIDSIFIVVLGASLSVIKKKTALNYVL